MDAPTPLDNAPEPSLPATSLMSRLTNIFVAPGEVFDEVRQAPPTLANWLVPLILTAAVGIVGSLIIFSQPAMLQQMRNAQDTQEARIRQQVVEGKISQQQADKSISVMQTLMGPSVLKAFGVLGAIFGSAINLFFLTLVVWLVGKFALGGNARYGQMLEMVSLAMMVSALGTIVTVLLVVICGNPGINLGPSIFISHFEPRNVVHRALAALNLMSLWYLAVLSLGLSRFTGVRFFKAAVWIYGLWAAMMAVILGLVAFQTG